MSSDECEDATSASRKGSEFSSEKEKIFCLKCCKIFFYVMVNMCGFILRIVFIPFFLAAISDM